MLSEDCNTSTAVLIRYARFRWPINFLKLGLDAPGGGGGLGLVLYNLGVGR